MRIDSDYLIDKGIIDDTEAVTRIHYMNNLFITNKSGNRNNVASNVAICLNYNILTMGYKASCMARWQEFPKKS